MESLFFVFGVLGVIFVIGGIITVFFNDDSGISISLLLTGIILAICGVVGSFMTSDAHIRAEIRDASDKQHITLVTDSSDEYYLFQAIYGDCKIGAELHDGQLILAGSEPAKVLTPELVTSICGASIAK
jgi:hypothetical protein